MLPLRDGLMVARKNRRKKPLRLPKTLAVVQKDRNNFLHTDNADETDVH
jgi:hypothetical protein